MIIPTPGSQVLSRFGWAVVQQATPVFINVTLKTPFAGSAYCNGRPEEFVFPTARAVLRVLNIAGVGFYSFVMFLPEDLVDACYHKSPKAQNEMRFLLDFGGCRFEQSDPFGICIEGRYVLIASWADRWAITEVPPNMDFQPSELGVAVASFRDRMHSTRSGIAYYVVLDTETSVIVWHEFLCENGWVAHPNTIRPACSF